ncbi:Peroxisomal biogenesis factor 3 [Smittium culicis]|uniref:Peroxisomal biogenesis factor 3 n=1 Tax=Smittium culicis TaxID=133412 RepID=A0A1R1Y395_9FUNG|nr:Peroxisomal biogenesis factor 3 [Smittium culicis]
MQESMEQESWAKKNISERFNRNLLDCQFTIQNLSSELILNVINEIDVESLLEELRTLQKIKKISTEVESENSNPTVIITEKSENQDKTALSINENDGSAISTTENKLSSNTSSENLDSTINSDSSYSIIKSPELTKNTDSSYNQSHTDDLQKNIDPESIPAIPCRTKKYDVEIHEKVWDLQINEYSSGFSKDEQNFLILSWWFLNKGWKLALEIIGESVDEIIGSLSLKSKLSISELSDLVYKINESIMFKGFSDRIPEILLPSNIYDYEDFFIANDLSHDLVNTERFNTLVRQAKDIFESDVMEKIFTIEIAKISSVLISSLKSEFPQASSSSDSLAPSGIKELSDSSMASSLSSINELETSVKEFEDFISVPEPKLSLVKLLPRIAKEVNQILYDSSNQYNEALFSSIEMNALSASIYTAKNLAA